MLKISKRVKKKSFLTAKRLALMKIRFEIFIKEKKTKKKNPKKEKIYLCF